MDADGEFYGIPLAVVTEVGRVAIIGGRLEENVYSIGESLNLIDLRQQARAGAALDAIKAKVKADGLPPWADKQTADVLLAWIGATKGAMKERDSVVHSQHSFERRDEDWEPRVQGTNQKADARPLDLAAIERQRARLCGVVDRGFPLWLSLLPELAPDLHMHLYGPHRGVPVITMAHGVYPELSAEDVQRLKEKWAVSHSPYVL